VTIGLIWVLWSHRAPRESSSVEPDVFPSVKNVADPGHRAGESRRFVPLDPLPENQVTRLGQTLQLGSLEVTPLDIAAGQVTLRHEIHQTERRAGGRGALMLKLRLKNLSNDSILVPLDEAFIRERGRGFHDSFIEVGPTQQIDMFPLAIVSEWSIVGQEFRELRPGESYETLVVSAPDALDRLAPEMTWRIRLRTDINQTELIGIQFEENQIRRLPVQKSEHDEDELDSFDSRQRERP
jgi:hypothetical protein